MNTTASRWNDPDIRDRAPALRKGRNKGVAAAVREAKRIQAELRDLDTLPENRRNYRRAALCGGYGVDAWKTYQYPNSLPHLSGRTRGPVGWLTCSAPTGTPSAPA